MEAKPLMAAMAMLSVMFAGCSDEEPKPSAEELCEGIFADGVCTPHTEPSVVIEGLEPQLPAYLRHEFTWRLDNGTRGVAPEPQVHSMDSRVLAITDGSAPDNTTGPDSFGEQVAQAEHKNLPDQFTATFSWEEVGATVSLWGYMLIDGQSVWNLITEITTVEPPTTGDTKQVNLSVGPPPSAAPTQLAMVLGDGLQFNNDNPALGYTVTFACNKGVTLADLPVPAAGSSTVVVVKRPTSCTWTAATDMGVEPADFTGSVNVNIPA